MGAEVVRLLSELGADVNIAMKDGATPAHVASQNGHAEVARLLCERGADVNIAKDDGATPAHNASWNGHAEVMRLLCELGADVNIATNTGVTPAHIASRNGHAEVARLLCELGADLNSLTTHGLSPLASACLRGSAMVVRILCIYGAARVCPRGSAHELSHRNDIRRFLARTAGFVNPLQYSEELTVDEARRWLRSERLRSFPHTAFVHQQSPACSLIEPALVWSKDAAALFPASCHRRARELLFIPWQEKGLPHSLILEKLLPFLINRWSPVRWSKKTRIT